MEPLIKALDFPRFLWLVRDYGFVTFREDSCNLCKALAFRSKPAYLCSMEEGKKIILFDGVCNLCNSSVQFVIKRDKKDVFRYAALQSEIGQKLVAERNIDTAQVDSIILIEPGVAYYTKSDAALEIAQDLGGLWKLTAVFSWIPTSIRNAIYDFVAKNRYKWFGKQESCMIPTPELKAKFLG